MQVILVKHLRKRGRVGDIVEVRDGFARNFLLPQNLAVRATEANKQLIEEQKREYEKRNASAKKEAEKIAKEIAGKDIIFIRQASDDGRLFGSVSNKEIAKELSKIISYDLQGTNIAIETAMKVIGVYSIEVDLHAEVITNIIVTIARSESEASDALRIYKSAQNSSSSGDQAV